LEHDLTPNFEGYTTAGFISIIGGAFGIPPKQTPPLWTKEIGALDEPFYLLQSAGMMKRLRLLCETQSPAPMRKRRLFTPPNFLEFA
jgi:hypothetical protein